MKNKAKTIWQHHVTQKAYRAAVVSLLGSLLILLGVLGQADTLEVDSAAVIAFCVSAASAAFRAALAVIIPAIAAYRDRLSEES